MRKLFYLFVSVMLAMTTGTTLTACLNDDDDDNTTPEITDAEIHARLMLMEGYYGGYLYFVNDSTEKTDSVAIEWSVSSQDTAVHVSNIPLKVFANGILHAERHEMLEKSEATFPLSSNIYFYNHSIDNADLYSYWVVPKNLKVEVPFTDEEGTEHTAQINFMEQLSTMSVSGYYTNYYAIGEFLKGKMLCYFIVKDIVIDNISNTVNKVLFIFNGE